MPHNELNCALTIVLVLLFFGKVVEKTADTDGLYPLQTSTVYRTLVSNSLNTLTSECFMRFTRLKHLSRPSTISMPTSDTPSESTCPSTGVDIEISEEDHIVFRFLEEKVSQIGLALKYINSRRAKKHTEIDSEAVEQTGQNP